MNQEEINKETFKELFEAIENNDINKVRKFVECLKSEMLMYPYDSLIIASKKGNLELVKYLVEKGASNINSALIIASENGYLELVKCLVEHGADINAEDFYGLSALTTAAMYNRLEIVKFFIEEKGMDINHKGSKGLNKSWTILMAASVNGHLNIFKYLLYKGADVNIEDNTGSTALWYASINRHENIRKILIEAGAK